MIKYRLSILFLLIFVFSAAIGQSGSNSWSEVKAKGSGVLVIAYSENSPFIYNIQGELAGIEFELLQDFASFLNEKYQTKLRLEFEHLYNFESLIDTLRTSQRPIIGIASISTLEERKKEFNITNPYMPDIEIIVSSKAFGSVSNLAEFTKMVRNNRAISVSNSTFERNILELKREYFPEINIEYVRHVDLLIETISSSHDAWGYISLPNYLTYYKNGKDIARQRFFMVENLGLSLATPLGSDWVGVVNEYILDDRFEPLINSLIEKHLGKAFGEVVKSISSINSAIPGDINSNREVGVLTLERELQDLKLKQSELEIDKKNAIIYVAIAGFVLVLIALFALYRLVQLKMNTNKSLSEKNEKIALQNAELSSLNIEKNELIGIVAHDLKNPLTSAMSVAELFSSEEVSEDQREYLSLIQRSLNRMNSLVAKILEIKVLESTSLKLNLAEMNLKKSTEQVIAALRIQSDNKGIRIETELSEITAIIDNSLLVQILDNLLSNAIKFSNHHSKVLVKLVEVDQIIRIEIKDEGPGILEEEKPKLFKKYQKLQARPTGGESSTGLGLSIVKKYVEAMNGKVWCESNQGHGATFIVEFKGNSIT